MKKNERRAVKIILFMIYGIFEVLNFSRIDRNSHSVSDTLTIFVFQSLILAIIFIAIYGFLKRELLKINNSLNENAKKNKKKKVKKKS